MLAFFSVANWPRAWGTLRHDTVKQERANILSNTNCKQITDLVFDYLNDNLSPNIKRDFKEHLKLCSDCVSFLNTYRKTVSVTGTVRLEEIPAKTKNQILDFLRKRIRKSRTNS